MPARLNNLVLQSPGTMGLNTQDADNVQDPRLCLQANNCIISKNGLMESRKGTLKTNASAATGTPTLDVVYSYVQDDGSEFLISTGGNKIWTGKTALADDTGGLTVTADDWQFQTYKGEVFGYQSGHAPIFWDGVAATFATIASKGTSAGIVNSSWHLAAFGRSWVGDTTSLTTILYSDLLIPEDFTGGSSGSVDLDTVWPHSNDTITTCAVHNNNLIVFCERSIIIYSGADDVTSFYLLETIASNGCVARDSVQTVGNDIFYLANDGVRSLARTVIQDNMPMAEISKDIRDDIITSINAATLSTVRSTYNEKEGFYLINFPGDKTYVCDVRLAEQNIFRWTTWTADIYGVATSYRGSDELYMGLNGGFLSEYSVYYDTNTTTGVVDQAYTLTYRSGWIDTGVQSAKSIWKKAVWYVSSLIDIQITTTWAYDFEDEENSYTKAVTGGTEPLYGTAVYGTDAYGSAYKKQKISVPLSKTGSIIKLGFQSVVRNGKFAFNKIDLFNKSGNIR